MPADQDTYLTLTNSITQLTAALNALTLPSHAVEPPGYHLVRLRHLTQILEHYIQQMELELSTLHTYLLVHGEDWERLWGDDGGSE